MTAQPPASHFVNGAYVEDESGPPMESIHPASGAVVARLHAASAAIVEQAVTSGLAAQKAWASTPPAERGRALRRAADIIRARNRELSELETLDTGKPIQETLVADAASAADALEFFGGLCQSINGEHIDLGGDFVYTRREPLGLCVGIGAWNYPIQVAGWKAAPALACGNAMIFKPSETTPLSTLKLAEIFMEAGAPAGLFNVVQGAGEVGARLASHPAVAKVSLTGSAATGAKVYQAAAAGIKHATMELGGKSPLIVFDDADIDDAVGAAMLGNFYSSGQICSNGTRVFVHRRAKDRFLDRLKRRTAAIRIGDPFDESVQMGPLVSDQQMRSVLSYIEAGRADGARLECGGHRLTEGAHAEGCFVAPTVFSDVGDDMRIAREEIFGPVMCVLDFDSEDEVLERANASEYGLSAGVFTRDLTRAHRVAAALEAGMCWINAYNLTPVEMPFGGVKRSGVGRENGRAAIEYYSRLKSVYVGMGPVDSPY